MKRKRCRVHHGMRMRAAVALAKRLFYRVDWVNATGELKMQVFKGEPFFRVNIRRAEATRQLTGALKRALASGVEPGSLSRDATGRKTTE